MVVAMATRTRQADDFAAIKAAMRTPWMPKRMGSPYDHCDHCELEPDQKCIIDCGYAFREQQTKKAKT